MPIRVNGDIFYSNCGQKCVFLTTSSCPRSFRTTPMRGESKEETPFYDLVTLFWKVGPEESMDLQVLT